MRPMKLVLGCVLAIAGGVAYADDSITLHVTAPKVGDKWTVDKTASVVLDVQVQGKKMAVTEDSVDKESVEVVKVKDGVVTEEKVAFTTYSDKHKAGGTEQSEPAPVSGKTY